MAWENVSVSIFNIPQSTINDFSIVNNTSGDVGRFISFNGIAPQNCGLQTNVYVWGDSTGLSLYADSGYDTIQFIGRNNGANDTSIFDSGESDLTSDSRFYSFVCAIDEQNQLGFLGFIRTWNSGGVPTSYYFFPGFLPPQTNKCYQLIKSQLIPPIVSWQSVPSISGKNGILSLVTLDSEAINDGEPVSGAAVSVFNQAPSTDNNVKDLADTYGSGEESSAVDVTVKYKVTLPPGGSFNVLKLVAKKDSAPQDATDGDKIIDISPSKTKKTVTGLDENSMYYFKIFAEDSNSNTSESDEKHILTSGDEGYNFDYTGEIIEWTVPKTGIYSLETWGAQGGNATDGTNSARGGYGSYAYGEVLLTQGEKLYINVGGQNGYGGGGNYILELDEYLRNLDYSNYIYISGGQNKVTPFYAYDSQLQQYYGTNKILVVGKSENLRPVWDSTNNCLRTNGTAGRYDYVFVAIPLPHRLYGVSKYMALGKRENNGNTYGSIGVGCIVNDSMRQTKGGNGFATDWDYIELDGDSGNTSDAGYTYYHMEDMPYIDYLTFELSQGNLFWKDNRLYFD